MLFKCINWGITSLSFFNLNSIFFTRLSTLKRPIYYKNRVKIDPLTMKIDSYPGFLQVLTPELKQLADIFLRHNYELRIAGGAVRDLLMHKVPQDIDLATVATPDEMKGLFTSEGVRMLNMKGEKHGTITARINDKQNFEVTTLRIDLVTDGRRAEVEFTKDWQIDAYRRDLTINALFLGLDGTVYDYCQGIEDLDQRKVKFVGDPIERIQEDYLRVLRYFRFYGRISVESDKHDNSTLEAIRGNLDGLKDISGERLWTEFKKILIGNHNKEITLRMIELGIFPFLGLIDCDVEEFKTVCDRAMPLNPTSATILAAFLKSETHVTAMYSRLRLSNYERDLCYFIVRQRSEDIQFSRSISHYQLALFNTATKTKSQDFKEHVCEWFKYIGDTRLCQEFDQWEIPKFPINGHMLIEAGIDKGPKLAKALMPLREKWVESKFTLTAEQLMDMVPSIIQIINKK